MEKIRFEDLDPSTIDQIIDRLGRLALLNFLEPSFVSGRAPLSVTAATYTLIGADFDIIANRAGTVTLTLPLASGNKGRSLVVKTIQNQTVVSASANVVPLIGGAAGTAILAATAGKWARLTSDGTNWVIMQGN